MTETEKQKQKRIFIVGISLMIVAVLGVAAMVVAVLNYDPPQPLWSDSDLGVSDSSSSSSSLREDIPYGYMVLSNESGDIVISYAAIWQYNKYSQIVFPGGVVGKVIINDDENSTFFSINGKMLEMKKNSINSNQSYVIIVDDDSYNEYDYRNPPATQAWWEIRVEKNNYMAEVSWRASPPKGETIVLPTTGKNFTYVGFMPNEAGDFVPMFIG